jgi:hypothetical protein
VTQWQDRHYALAPSRKRDGRRHVIISVPAKRGRAVSERCGVMSAFEELGVSPELIRACDGLGWALPTPVQAEAVPLILGGGDVMVGASSTRRACWAMKPVSFGVCALMQHARADAPQRRRPGVERQAPLPCRCSKSCTRLSQARHGQAAARSRVLPRLPRARPTLRFSCPWTTATRCLL